METEVVVAAGVAAGIVDWLVPLCVSMIALAGVIWSGRRTARSMIEAEAERDRLARSARAREVAADRRQFLRETVAEVARAGRERSTVATLQAFGLLKADALAGLDPQLGERNRRAVDELATRVDRVRLTIADEGIQSQIDAVWVAHEALQDAMSQPTTAVLQRGKAEGSDLKAVYLASAAMEAAVDALILAAQKRLAEPVAGYG